MGRTAAASVAVATAPAPAASPTPPGPPPPHARIALPSPRPPRTLRRSLDSCGNLLDAGGAVAFAGLGPATAAAERARLEAAVGGGTVGGPRVGAPGRGGW